MGTSIAIIGMACEFPDAHSPEELWQNVLAGRRAFRILPDERLPKEDYWDVDPAAPGKTYLDQMAVLSDWAFDPLEFRISPKTFIATDIAHWLALWVTRAALQDAGLDLEAINRSRIGIILGNTLAGEFSRSHNMEFRWPYVERVIRRAVESGGWREVHTDELVTAIREVYHAPFPGISEDSLAGNMSNTIAGRVCNYFDFGAGGYTIDGACSSSLLSVVHACNALINGDMDYTLCGGVDVSLDSFEIVGFAKTQALTKEDIRPYSEHADGMITGEGCGIFVLTREEEARAAGHRVHARIRGWGYSSDGAGGGITAPLVDGQMRALKRAYQRAGYSMSSIGLIEGHGTGTPLGDEVEITAIQRVLGDEPPGDHAIGLGSIKANIGHTKAAAGAAGLTKAVMALKRKILPPTLNCEHPTSVLGKPLGQVRPNVYGRPWEQTAERRRASVSSMGFGGANSHVTLEETDPDTTAPPDDLALLTTAQASELVAFSGDSPAALQDRVDDLLVIASRISRAELTDLAARLAAQPSSAHDRIAIVASSPWHLASVLGRVSERLARGVPLAELDDPSSGLYAGSAKSNPRWAALFPGQGSQYLNMGRHLYRREPRVAAIYDEAQTALEDVLETDLRDMVFRDTYGVDDESKATWENDLKQTHIAQPAIVLSAAATLRFLRDLGLEPSAALGHSLGEITALHASGALDDITAVRVAALRGGAMRDLRLDDPGAMVAVAAPPAEIQLVLADFGGDLVISNYNAPVQTVVSGPTPALDPFVAACVGRGYRATRLPVSHAFHSDLVAPAARSFLENLVGIRFASPDSLGVFSTATGARLAPGQDLRNLLGEHIRRPVRFTQAVKALYEEFRPDFWLEVGPGGVLTGLVREILAAHHPLCLSTEFASEDGFHTLNTVLARAYVLGFDLDLQRSFVHRFAKPFSVERYDPQIITNPCERGEVHSSDILGTSATSKRNVRPAKGPQDHTGLVLASAAGLSPGTLQDYLERRAVFLGKVIRADLEDRTGDPEVQSSQRPIQAANAPTRDGVTNMRAPETADRPSVWDEASIGELLVELVSARTGFPSEMLSLEQRLLDDLNLDSIKSADIIAQAAERVGIAGDLDPASLAGATIQDVALALHRASGQGPQANKNPPADIAAPFHHGSRELPATPGWVREFALDYVDAPAAPVEFGPNLWSDAVLYALCEPADRAIAEDLSRRVGALGGRMEILSYEEIEANQPRLDGVVAILPRVTRPELSFAEPLSRMVRRLVTVAALRIDPEPNVRAAAITLVSFGDGYFGTTDNVPAPEASSVKAFAASLHLERPEAKVRALDFAPTAKPGEICERIVSEMGRSERFAAVGFDVSLRRRIPRAFLREPASYPPRNLELGTDDVLLVTGGGRGITAECAVSLARQFRPRLSLLGRTSLVDSEAAIEIQQTLQRLRAAGSEVYYYQCDVTDAASVSAAVQRTENELGPITGLIHGAGLNRPSVASQVTAAAALEEVAPKNLGFALVGKALNERPLKIVVGLTSVIGAVGMPGNAWYAYANETLALQLRQFSIAHPETAVQAIAYSVWSEVGMGAKLGAAANLEEMGVGAISTDAGVARFLRFVKNDPGVPEVIVSGSLGKRIDTWCREETEVPRARRYLEHILRFEPGVELVCRPRLSLERDPDIEHHMWRGSYLFPTVFGLEAMAQAAAYVSGRHDLSSVRIEDINLEQPVTLEPRAETEIEIHAVAEELEAPTSDPSVSVAIRTARTGFSKPHFSAVFHVQSTGKDRPNSIETKDTLAPLQPKRDLYGQLLFQRGRFRTIESVQELSAERCTVSILSGSNIEPSNWLLGDPFTRDALLQSAQLILSQDLCLPVQISSLWRWSTDTSVRDATRCVTRLLWHEGEQALFEVSRVDEAGVPVETLTGYRVQVIEHHGEYPSPEELARGAALLEAVLDRALSDACEKAALQAPCVLVYPSALHGLPKAARREVESPLVMRCVEKALGHRPETCSITWSAEGRPELHGRQVESLGLSIAHDDALCLVTVGNGIQGCDITPVAFSGKTSRETVLGSRWSTLANWLAAGGDHTDRAYARIWAARECLKKAVGETDGLVFESRHDAAVVLQSKALADTRRVLTIAFETLGSGELVAAFAVTRRGVGRNAGPPSARDLSESISSQTLGGRLEVGADGRPVFVYRFPITFREASSASRRLYFSHYFDWIGRLREYMAQPIHKDLASCFQTGDWGIVTNFAETRVHGDAESGDVIEGRLWLARASGPAGSTLDFDYEWLRVEPDADPCRIATSRMRTTWVALNGRHSVSVDRYPDFAERFVAKLAGGRENLNHAVDWLPKSATPELGSILWRAPEGPPHACPRLVERRFRTSREDSNLVGNIYFAKYYELQGRVVDDFLHRTIRDLDGVSDIGGELICRHCKVEHIREAFPFETIVARMHILALYEKGLDLYFEYFNEDATERSRRLAFGQHVAEWNDTDTPGFWLSTVAPRLLRAINPAPVRKREPANSAAVAYSSAYGANIRTSPYGGNIRTNRTILLSDNITDNLFVQ